MVEKKYSGYGYHGGGRKATGIKRVSICISGKPDQIYELKKMAAQEEKSVSAFILEKTGVNKNVSTETLAKICTAQGCNIEDIVEFSSEE